MQVVRRVEGLHPGGRAGGAGVAKEPGRWMHGPAGAEAEEVRAAGNDEMEKDVSNKDEDEEEEEDCDEDWYAVARRARLVRSGILNRMRKLCDAAEASMPASMWPLASYTDLILA